MNNINVTELINKLTAMMNREQSDSDIAVPNDESEQKMFSAGYVEAISDVIYILNCAKIPAM